MHDSNNSDTEDQKWEVDTSGVEQNMYKEDMDASMRTEDSGNKDSDGDSERPEEMNKPSRFQISSKIQENYIKMIQNSMSNEEWNMFCRAKKNCLRQNKRQWKLLNEDR